MDKREETLEEALVEVLAADVAKLKAQLADLHDQIGERDGVIAQLRAKLARYMEVYADPDDTAKHAEAYAQALGADIAAEMRRIKGGK